MNISNRITKRGFSALRAAGALGMVSLLSLLSFGCMSDSVLGDDEKYMPDRIEDDGNGNPVTVTPNGCDMTGTWIAQFRGQSSALGFVARSYNWFYYELESDGDDVIIHRGWDCGFQVCNATMLALTNTQMDALALRNRQDGEIFHNLEATNDSVVVEQRRAHYKNLGDGTCEFEMGRWWWVRSAPLDRYPARSEYETMDFPEVQTKYPLPPKGTPATPQNDWDGSHVPGLELMLDSPISGTRDAAQRDWNEFGPGIIQDGLDDFTVPADFNNEELLYAVSATLLDQESTPIRKGNTVRFVRLSEQAPEDPIGFRNFCNEQVAEHFRSANWENETYCSVKSQKVTELPSGDEELGNTDPG